MNFPVPCLDISLILGEYGPLAKVAANWPLVESALDSARIYSPMCAVAAIATISVETARFSPVKEGGDPVYLSSLYENRPDLGNIQPGDGAKFASRGFVRIVGRRDYEHFGREIGLDLVANPDAPLSPAVAAAILAVYFKERNVRTFADRQNWEIVRRRVSGGLSGWPRFNDAATNLVAALKHSPPAALQNSRGEIEEFDR